MGRTLFLCADECFRSPQPELEVHKGGKFLVQPCDTWGNEVQCDTTAVVLILSCGQMQRSEMSGTAKESGQESYAEPSPEDPSRRARCAARRASARIAVKELHKGPKLGGPKGRTRDYGSSTESSLWASSHAAGRFPVHLLTDAITSRSQ